MLKSFKHLLFEGYYCFWIISYFLRVFIPSFRPALFMMIINVLLVLIKAVSFFYADKKSISSSNIVVYFLIIWCFLSSVISLVHNEITVVYNSFIYLFFPIILFFYGDDKEIDYDLFWYVYLLTIVANNILGIICFYTKASFFINYLYYSSDSAYLQITHHAGAGRLVTLLGSIETGVLSGIGIIVAIGLLMKKKYNRIVVVICMIVCLVALILTQQRGPLFALFVCFLFTFLYSLFKRKIIKLRFFVIILVTIAIVLYILSIKNPIVFEWIIDRIQNPSDAINERYDYQWDVLKNNLGYFDWIIGRGLGSFGFFVEESTRQTRIFDQMYFNILGEIGIIGFSLFFLIILKCSVSFIKDVKSLFAPFFTLFLILFVGLGTTLTYYPQIMPAFWISAGYLFKNMK